MKIETTNGILMTSDHSFAKHAFRFDHCQGTTADAASIAREVVVEIKSMTELSKELEEETRAVRAGEKPVGTWRLQGDQIVHTQSGREMLSLSDLDTPRRAVQQIARMAGKNERWMTSEDVGDFVRLLVVLDIKFAEYP